MPSLGHSELTHCGQWRHIDFFFNFQGHRGVPVILPRSTKKGLKFLTDPVTRRECGVADSNPYVFAKPGKCQPMHLSENEIT